MKILIVEDEHRIAATLKKGLEQENHIVDVCYDGNEGYDLAASESYDVIVLDLMLPRMDGMTVCRKLREQGIHTPILILTAKGQVDDKVAGLDAGADDYLTKPFSFEELVARIRALARRPKVQGKALLTVLDLTLDTKSFAINRSGKPVSVSGKEFALLEYMMKNAGRVLSKEQIISHVWDYDADILPNTVEVYMRNLRNKIDKPFKNKRALINTIRGFGYKIGVS